VQTPIILVDDDELYREALGAELEDHGFAVLGFADGAALLAAVQAGIEAELALIDWTLPHMSGLDLLRALRARGSTLTVAFLTGREGVERVAAAIAAGAVDFIDKTCGTEELVQKLGRLVRQSDLPDVPEYLSGNVPQRPPLFCGEGFSGAEGPSERRTTRAAFCLRRGNRRSSPT